MLVAQETKRGLVKGQEYNLFTDGNKAVLKTKGGRKTVFIPINQINKFKLKMVDDEFIEM